MRVFMLGWEFPPSISGGLGTACYGLTKAMSSIGTDIMFVLPRPVTTPFSTHLRLVSPRPDSAGVAEHGVPPRRVRTRDLPRGRRQSDRPVPDARRLPAQDQGRQ